MAYVVLLEHNPDTQTLWTNGYSAPLYTFCIAVGVEILSNFCEQTLAAPQRYLFAALRKASVNGYGDQSRSGCAVPTVWGRLA